MNHLRAIYLNEVFVYHNQSPVLQGIDFSLNYGEFCYLLGKTGSGKSSLLRLIYADLPLIKGQAEIVGYKLEKLKSSHISLFRQKLGIVFQDFQFLPHWDVNKNLCFLLKASGWKDKKKIDQRIDEVLDSINMLTHKYKNIYEISRGEQQCIAIARALLNYPKLIIADEPTGDLDTETSLQILELMLSINQSINCAVLIATHNYDLIKKIPARTLKCEDKKIQILR